MTPYKIARNLADNLIRGEVNRSPELIREKVRILPSRCKIT